MRNLVQRANDSPRAKFRTFCDIAPFEGASLGEFRSVLCCDLGTRGFSFFDRRSPTAEFLVARFRRPGGFVNLLCEVERCAPRRDEAGELKLWVECRFVGRLNSDDQPRPQDG